MKEDSEDTEIMKIDEVEIIIPSGNYTQIHFVKKYRHKMETNYIFYKTSIHDEISLKLNGWLVNNMKEISGQGLKDYDPSRSDNEKEKIYLSKIEKWKFFEDIFTGKTDNIKEFEKLEKIKKNIKGFIIYTHIKNGFIGQIRKITAKSVLSKSGLYKIFFKNGVFNKIEEDIGLQIDKNADFLFIMKENIKPFGIIFNKANFKSIFDMNEQEKKEAISQFQELKILSQNKHSSVIKDIIEKDRQIQKMLISPAAQKYMELGLATLDELKKVKQKIKSRVAYEIDENSGEFVLPLGREKQALKDIIKVLSGRYAKDLKGKHILENNGLKDII